MAMRLCQLLGGPAPPCPAYHGPVQDPAVQPLRGGEVRHFLIFQHVWSMSRWSVAIDLREAAQKVH